jgi:DNA-binding winged helix-turn-helix (wHTH) protein
MSPTRQFSFGPFRLDPSNARLWRGTQALALTPKAFELLQYLLEHAGELVTKEALFTAVWPDAVVSDSALKVCMAEIRRALQDDPRTPQFIKTEHRRGYRVICPVQTLKFDAGGAEALSLSSAPVERIEKRLSEPLSPQPSARC